MCIEDIRLGREKVANCKSSTGTGPMNVILLGPDPDRVSITVSTDSAGPCYLQSTNSYGTSVCGLILNQYAPIVTLTVETHGDLVFGGWFIGIVSGLFNVYVTEVTLKKQ